MTIAGLIDATVFLRFLTFRKVWNGLKVWGSYHLSSLLGIPIHWGNPIMLSVEPTTHCNLRCPECPSGLRSFTRDTGFVGADTYVRMVDNLKDDLGWLYLYFQGEPMLHPAFNELTRYAFSKGVYTVTSTNGHYLDEKKSDELVRSGLSRIIISLDGFTEASYTTYRKGGQLSKVKAGIETLVKKKKELNSSTPYIIIQTIVFRQNETEIEDIKKWALTTGVDKFSLKTAQVYEETDPNQLLPHNEKFLRYRKNNNGTYYIPEADQNKCWKLWHSAVITWDGNVVPCCFDKDANHQMGNVLTQDWNLIWKGEKYNNFRRKLTSSRKEIDICKNCSEGTKVWA